jgi:hypothetical protein
MASADPKANPRWGAIAAGVVNVPPGVPKAAWVPVGEFHATTVSPLSEAATCTLPNGRISSAAVAGDAHRASATAGARHAARTARVRFMVSKTEPTSERVV